VGFVGGIGCNGNRIFYLYGGADMKGYCRYVVIDKATGLELIVGEKWKEYSELHFCGSFRKGFFRKTMIGQFMQEKRVGGVDCVVVYWIIATTKDPCVCSVVTPFGQFLGLKGSIYELFPRRILKCYDFRDVLIKHGLWK